jgi:L-asparaginase
MKSEPKLIIHGGLDYGHQDERKDKILRETADTVFRILCESDSQKAVLQALSILEDEPLFNAGRGSTLQRDGKARMSAAIMNGETNRFAGVINIQNSKPSRVVECLLDEPEYTILASPEAENYAKGKGIDTNYSAFTDERRKEYEKNRPDKCGTVGVVALDSRGNICAGTSTGGIGGEIPGRVSDSPTVAGTYASPWAGVSCTGKGEQIVYQAVAAKVVTRIQDGKNSRWAVRKTIEEANNYGYAFGFISIDYSGNMEVGETDPYKVRYVKVYDRGHIESWNNRTKLAIQR